jgi:Zn-dependent protease with chaperone function
VGFAAAFVILAWGISALLCGGVLATKRIVAQRGPQAERILLGSALVLAPLSSALLIGVVGGRSLLLANVDHCAVHGHHPHLCLVHGGGWVEVPFALVFVAMVAAYVVVRMCQLASVAISARRALRQLTSVGREVQAGLWIVPAAKAFCFTAGIVRPRIYVSSAIWESLDDDERAAMLAHERTHIRQRDLAWRALLGVATLFGAPILARLVLAAWERATERACDREAARVVEPEVVASALVRMSRLQLATMPGMAFGAAGALDERVHALLDEPVHVERPIRVMRAVPIALFGIATTIAVLASDPIHHALETLLGIF